MACDQQVDGLSALVQTKTLYKGLGKSKQSKLGWRLTGGRKMQSDIRTDTKCTMMSEKAQGILANQGLQFSDKPVFERDERFRIKNWY